MVVCLYSTCISYNIIVFSIFYMYIIMFLSNHSRLQALHLLLLLLLKTLNRKRQVHGMIMIFQKRMNRISIFPEKIFLLVIVLDLLHHHLVSLNQLMYHQRINKFHLKDFYRHLRWQRVLYLVQHLLDYYHFLIKVHLCTCTCTCTCIYCCFI